jgi:hypothetical protein
MCKQQRRQGDRARSRRDSRHRDGLSATNVTES